MSNDKLANLYGREPATQELLDALASKGRTYSYVIPGTDEHRYFEMFGIEANAGGEDLRHILLRENPSKAAVLEEFLHGVQVDVGFPQSSENISWREYHAKDFLIRHQSLVGLPDEDIEILHHLRDRELASATTRQLRDEWIARRQPAPTLDHTAARGVDGVSLAVNVAQGNVAGAALDAASMAADTQAVQQAALESAAKVIGREGLESAAKVIGREGLESGLKKIPVVGAVITAGTTLYATGAQAWHGNYDLAAAELAAGTAETIGNIPGFGLGDGARELARGGIIAAGGERFEAVEKSGLRQLGEAALDVGQQMTGHITGQITGQSLEQVLPAQYRNMTLGSDAMGERSEISRIALERMNGIAQASIKRGHMIVLQDGSVQPGSVGFGNNPQIAAGKNGGTLGVIYAGTGAMNDAQYNTVNNIHHWLTQQRQNEGLTAPVEVIAGSLATAQLLQLPTPQGFTPGQPLAAASVQPLAAAPAQPASPQRRAPNNGLGGG